MGVYEIMTIRIIGAALILLGCGGFGVAIAKTAKNEIIALQNFLLATEYMICELRYRMTPLPDLCIATSQVTKGVVSSIFSSLGKGLKLEASANVSACMASALSKYQMYSDKLTALFENLGHRLGIFDLEGQIEVLSSLRMEGKGLLQSCLNGHTTRSRSCKTIALCAGAAIVILMI